MKRNIVYTLLGVVLILVNLSINYDASSNDDTLGVFSKFEMSFTQAKAGGDNNVKCKCAFWWFNNKNCLANNGGSTCYYGLNVNCTENNVSCGGTNPTPPDPDPVIED